MADIFQSATSQSALKVALLISNTIMYMISLTSPNPPANNDDQKTYNSTEKAKDWLSSQQRWAPGSMRKAMHFLTLLEVYAIVASATSLSLPSPQFMRSYGSATITPAFLLGTLLIHAGTVLRIACYRHLGRHFTFELSLRKNHKLISDGPYAIVRHPSYTGSAIVFAGTLLATLGPGSWFEQSGVWDSVLGRVAGWFWVFMNVVTAVVLTLRVPKEDLVLKNEFKEQWVSWKRRTPYAMVPFVY